MTNEEKGCVRSTKNLRVCVSGGHCDGKDPAYVEELQMGAKIAKWASASTTAFPIPE